MKLLVAVDGSEHSLEAARYAVRLREAGLKAEIVLATVQEPTFLYELVLPPTSDVLERVSGAVGHRALEGAEALLREAGVPFEFEIGSGEIAPTLLSIAQARDCDGNCHRAADHQRQQMADRSRPAFADERPVSTRLQTL